MKMFTRHQDPLEHVKMFHAQMLISRGSDVVKCKLFARTLAEIALDWFNSLPKHNIVSFDESN